MRRSAARSRSGRCVGGLLTERLGWEWIFFVNVPIGIAAIVLTETKLANVKAHRSRSRSTGPGWSTFSPALFLLIFGLIRGNAEGWGSPRSSRSLVAAVVLLVAFLVIEVRRENPMLDLSLFRKPVVRRRLDRRLRALGRDVRDVPLPDALHPGRARLLAARRRACASCR